MGCEGGVFTDMLMPIKALVWTHLEPYKLYGFPSSNKEIIILVSPESGLDIYCSHGDLKGQSVLCKLSFFVKNSAEEGLGFFYL